MNMYRSKFQINIKSQGENNWLWDFFYKFTPKIFRLESWQQVLILVRKDEEDSICYDGSSIKTGRRQSQNLKDL